MDYRIITNKRQFKSATGLDREAFIKLAADCESHYYSEHGRRYEDYIREDVFASDSVVFQTLSDCLFFVLFQQKNDLVYDSLGAVFGTSGSVAHRYFDRYSAFLQTVLAKKTAAGTQLPRCR